MYQMTLNIFLFTSFFNPCATPFSYSTPAAPPSPDMSSIFTRISSSSCAIVLLLLAVAPRAGPSLVVLGCLALLLLGSSDCCSCWDPVSASEDVNRFEELGENTGLLVDMELAEGLVVLEVGGESAAAPNRRVAIDAGTRLMAIGEVLALKVEFPILISQSKVESVSIKNEHRPPGSKGPTDGES